MNNTNKDKENEILKLAIEAFRKNVPPQLNIKTFINQIHYDNFRPDIELTVEINGKEVRYRVEIKNYLAMANIMLLQIIKNENLLKPFLFVTKYINPLMADKLAEKGIEFIDAAGNAFINQPPIYVFVKGNKPPVEITENYPARKTFTPTGLKIIYALLCNPGLENTPFRKIADEADVALGTVGWFMRALRGAGFLLDAGGKEYILLDKDKLLQRWVTEYPERLRPKHMLGRYSGEHDGWWNQKELHNLNAKWGGEVAAAKLTRYLYPEIITIYTKKEYLNQLLMECRLKKDPKGEIEIIDQFWNFEENTEYRDLVDPILIYADLVATGNQRNIETAKMIYDEHIVRFIG
jgi:hypothetical protein